jgi:Tfp pilus assembly protein PilF
MVFEREEESGQALEAYRRALEIRPDYVDAHLNLANLFMKKGFDAEAEEHYQAVLEQQPQHAAVYNNLAVIYYHERRYPTAWAYLKYAERLGADIHPEFRAELQAKIRQ